MRRGEGGGEREEALIPIVIGTEYVLAPNEIFKYKNKQ